MTTARRVGLASIVLVSLGAGAAYWATMMALHGHEVYTRQLSYLILGLVAALTTLLVAFFWRGLHAGFKCIAGQLDRMTREKQIGLVRVPGGEELERITIPLNRFLTTVQQATGQLESTNRELQIQSRIAEAEKRHTEAIIFSISDAVLVTNRFDELILANAAAERLLGFKLVHSLRQNIDHIIQDTALVRLLRETRNGARSHTRKVVEHTIDSRGQGRTYRVTLSCVMAPQASNEVSGVVAVLHDVTRELETARMKSDFVSSVSHELRTPLSSIKAYVEMLRDGEAEDGATQQEFYEIIADQTDRLTRLIENILDISRIESGVMRVVREPLNLSKIADDVLSVLAPQARAAGIDLANRLDPMIECVQADRDMVHQAMLNLVGNALKYTAQGGKVTVTTRMDDRRGLAVCEVTDTGVGISSDDLPRIFDKFYRASGHEKMAKGTGLGLTLVKHIVETVHDGRLSVTSETGKGSTFRFELPVAA